ncbi:hypothetical protein ACFFX1_11095 [Dactylosporangium sucinum]|uniref:Uncharacterized protein n=1 Tax=Dactylosporangium sucinum TaxID=1424081 RepID=A0A917TGN4_9ACTN|nr:hypothetical protein [Dactylosporangium sucinum]GGM22505.1 hypothetical protein GCM10007977_024580 [Dactylosporangium sucinum]
MTTPEAGNDELIQQVLQVVAHATGPIGRFDIADAIDPGDPDLQEGTAEHEAMLEQRIAIIRAAVDAEQAGLLESERPAGGDGADLVRITAQGREQLQVRG